MVSLGLFMGLLTKNVSDSFLISKRNTVKVGLRMILRNTLLIHLHQVKLFQGTVMQFCARLTLDLFLNLSLRISISRMTT